LFADVSDIQERRIQLGLDSLAEKLFDQARRAASDQNTIKVLIKNGFVQARLSILAARVSLTGCVNDLWVIQCTLEERPSIQDIRNFAATFADEYTNAWRGFILHR
jgi:hypothetical protein